MPKIHWRPREWARTVCGISVIDKPHIATTPARSDTSCGRCMDAPIVATSAETHRGRMPLDIA